ncbi:hypothetical protein JIG36_50100 [Actinoplanes sp. LDG1-06]|uniref:Uncharacterized protein n=1 Tax=Paractinoplanes ovalisporus TaxID=2810368 RepID=A0ABS2AUX0_9ACTN|nr:hypothetical protein [Actinoplanes ovalisporus]MBM2623670.1 hypothetical protein [Actinoplanes ovalisporus]
MISQRWLIAAGAMCSAGLLWSVVLIAGLLAGVRLVPTAVAVAVAAVLTLPAVIAGVLGNRWYYRTTRPRVRWSLTSWVPPHVPHWASMLAGVFFFGFWLAVVVAFAGLDGRTDGPLPPADQARQQALEQQISLGVLGALAVGGVFMTGAILTHHAAPQPTETQSAGQALA